MVNFRELEAADWDSLRDIRLRALHDSPDNFLATYRRERQFEESTWRAELRRGRWIVGTLNAPISLVGLIPYEKESGSELYLEYMWVAPEHRRAGIAKKMLDYVIDVIDDQIKTIYLYVLDGNDPATWLYKRVGFVCTAGPQPLLEAKPGRFEQLMQLDLELLRSSPRERRTAPTLK